MRQTISQSISWLIVLCRAVVLISVLILIAAVSIQIFARSFLPIAPVWTEELTRFAVLGIVFFGAGPSLLSGDMVNVDFVLERIGDRYRRLLTGLGMIITAAFAAILIKPAYDFAQIGKFQTSPSMEISMIWIFSGMVVLMVLICIFGLVGAYRVFRNGRADLGQAEN